MKILTILFSFLTCNIALAQTNWTQKADFGGTARWSAIGASIGTKGYIGMGRDDNGRQNDLWEWNQTTNTWTQKANFPSLGREGAIGFAIGNKLYIGTGYDGNTYQNDFWEYDPSNNTWTQKANIPVGRAEGVGFSIGTKGYMMTGSTSSSVGGSNDLWEWDQTTNMWTQKASIPVTGTFIASGFSIGTKGYLFVDPSNFWEYNPANNTWTQKANIGLSTNWGRAADFSANGKGYLGGIGQNTDELWEYSPTTNTWKHLENIPNGEREISTGFSIGNMIYVGTGTSQFPAINKKDLWEGNPSNLCAYPSVVTNPSNQTVNLFGNAAFNVNASGTNLSYQWQTNIGSGYQNLSNAGQYNGTNSNSLSISNVLTSNNNQRFLCVVSSGYCSVKSDSATLSVSCLPLISTQPTNQSAFTGNNTYFSVHSSNTNISYQWQTNFGVGFQNISNAGQYLGANNDTLKISSVTISNNNQLFRCLVSSGTCIDTSVSVSLSVSPNAINEYENTKEYCSVFPNPTTNIITIKGITQPVVTVYNLMGQKLIVTKGSNAVSLAQLPIGIYLVQVFNKDGELVKNEKVVKE